MSLNAYEFIHMRLSNESGETMLLSALAEYSDFGMNTEITCSVFGEKAEAAVTEAKAELLRLERILSRYISYSDVSRINQHAGKGHVHISVETYEVLSCAVLLSEISQGLFDISVGPLIDLWNYKHSFRKPKKVKIRHILPLVNFHALILNSDAKTASLQKPGQSIDLGGIGKGYAGDRFIKILQNYGITSGFINIGGNVSTLGNKPDGTPWSVGIRDPRHTDCLIGAVKVTGRAVVTSGDYERFFIDREGKRWHHILNPTTGYPAESGLISVTVIADSAMIADSLSTAIFVAGIHQGLGYLARFHGAEAVLVNNRQQVFITQGLERCYQTAEGIETTLI